MYEQDVIVTTKYGPCPSFVACPERPGPFPGVIFYMDAPGIREELRNMTRRIARKPAIKLAVCPQRSLMLLRSAASTMRSASSMEIAIGFSTTTCLPFSAATIVCSAW